MTCHNKKNNVEETLECAIPLLPCPKVHFLPQW